MKIYVNGTTQEIETFLKFIPEKALVGKIEPNNAESGDLFKCPISMNIQDYVRYVMTPKNIQAKKPSWKVEIINMSGEIGEHTFHDEYEAVKFCEENKGNLYHKSDKERSKWALVKKSF